jgi:hypothetical protein
MTMIRPTLAALIGAAVLTVGVTTAAFADALPNTDETFSSAQFTLRADGVDTSWSVLATRDARSGSSIVAASASAFVDTTCQGGDQDGQPGFRSVSFTGQRSVRFLIPTSLRIAAAGARIHGTETTFDSCSGSETVVDKSYVVGLAVSATGPAVTSSGEKCIDTEQVLSSTFTFRTAAGAALIDDWHVAVADAVIGHQVSTYRLDPICAEV